jgi:hypothetical protein
MFERIEAFTVTQTKNRKVQIKWFEREGITYKIDAQKNVYTSKDWMDGKDKYQAQNDDGFNMGAIA